MEQYRIVLVGAYAAIRQAKDAEYDF